MKVEKWYAGNSKNGEEFIAKIEGEPIILSTNWRVEIRKKMNYGGFELVYNTVCASLYSAEKKIQKWKKGTKWAQFSRN